MENFGKKGRDKVTGFTGAIIGKCTYAYGCDQYCLQPGVDEKGSHQDSRWFDVGRVEVFEVVFTVASVHADKPGCEEQPHPNI
jgi:hypothetical protein